MREHHKNLRSSFRKADLSQSRKAQQKALRDGGNEVKFLFGLITLFLTVLSLIVVYLFVVNVDESRGNLRSKREKNPEPLLGVVYRR